MGRGDGVPLSPMRRRDVALSSGAAGRLLVVLGAWLPPGDPPWLWGVPDISGISLSRGGFPPCTPTDPRLGWGGASLATAPDGPRHR